MIAMIIILYIIVIRKIFLNKKFGCSNPVKEYWGTPVGYELPRDYCLNSVKGSWSYHPIQGGITLNTGYCTYCKK